MPAKQNNVAICVPVRNEEHALPSLLTALTAQKGIEEAAVSCCFFLDNCDDGSRSLIQAAQDRLPFEVWMEEDFTARTPNAGRARRRAVDVGLNALRGTLTAALLTTDADTVPAENWISSNLAALRHADVVTGDIRQSLDGFSYHHARVKSYFDRLHMLNTVLDPVPWEARPSHHHVGGASMAFSREAYRTSNGFKDLERGEDIEFVSSARHLGLRVRRDASIFVHTSTRRHGRAPGGFSSHLLALDDANGADHMLVVDPCVAARQYRAHASARAIFRDIGTRQTDAFAKTVGMDPRRLFEIRAMCKNEESFAMKAVPIPADAEPLPLMIAERKLERLIEG